MYVEALALISVRGISTVANNIGPLLGYISPCASDVSGLIYVDRLIIAKNIRVLAGARTTMKSIADALFSVR